MGINLETYSADELQELEKDLDLSLKNIRARKVSMRAVNELTCFI